MFEERYADLACAIVNQAVKDYRQALKGHSYSKESIERFFRSEWCFTLCHIDGEAIIDELKERNRRQTRGNEDERDI